MENNKVFKGLPEACYTTSQVTNEVILIKRGESGYYKLNENSTRSSDELNEILGVTKVQERAMVIGSMHGWDVPGANPENYNEDGSWKKSE